MTYALRPHQETAISELRRSFGTGHKRPVLQASTGFGKTLIAVDIIKSALSKSKRVVFVVDRIQLVDQTSQVFDKHGLDHGVIQADHWRRNHHPLQIASVHTLTKRKVAPFASLIIVDEAHSLYESFVKMLDVEFNGIPVIGLSATPFTKGMGKVYDDLIVVESTQSLIEQGYLCDFEAYGPAGPDLQGVKVQAGDYNQKQLAERVNKPKIVGDVVSTWLRLGQNRQTVCFAVNVAHSKSIVDEFKANGVTAAHIDAYTEPEDRDEILSAHEAGEIKVLSNVGITTKGWDSPNTSCLILARPTKSLMLYIQMVGRVLRTADGKDKAVILDHGSNIERLGFPTDDLPQYLCNGDLSEAKKQEKKEKKEVLPTACKKCTYLSTEFICPRCGHEPERMPNVEAKKGTLKKLEKATMSDKNKWYSMLLGYARSKGMKDGWAAHKYREKFGVWPSRKTGVRAAAPDTEVMNYIKYLNIKASKAFHASPEPGFDYSLKIGNDGRKMIRVEKDGVFKGWATQSKVMKSLVGIK